MLEPTVISLNLANLPTLAPLVLTIGNFDGVHLGHQTMLEKTCQIAKSKNLASAVMIFEPQPREFFDPANAPARLTNLDEKLNKIKAFAIDFVLVVPFDEQFANLTALAFCQVLQGLNVKAMILGDDFRFGQGRGGDVEFLRQFFEIYQVDSVLIDGVRVSSTAIRSALAVGDLPLVARLLGQAYAITGQVVHGDKIGRQLGFPTANIALNRIKPALQGVFGADILAYKDGQAIDLYRYFKTGIQGIRPNSLFGAVNVGTRPSVGGIDYRLEVHLPDFVGDLYGLSLTVVFCHYLHPEYSYANLESLKTGIQNDIEQLLNWRHSL